MSQKKSEFPSLKKTPLDFLSREEARQAVNPDDALDASPRRRGAADRPEQREGAAGAAYVACVARQSRLARLARLARFARPHGSHGVARLARLARLVVRR